MYEAIKIGTRKARTTNKTMVVSLPRVWIVNYGINAGDLLDISMLEDGSLVVKKEVKK